MSNHNDEKLKQAVMETGGLSNENLTLRDKFAIEALQGFMISDNFSQAIMEKSNTEGSNAYAVFSKNAYAMADAMLKERDK